jgi:hypothetical protein
VHLHNLDRAGWAGRYEPVSIGPIGGTANPGSRLSHVPHE